MEHSLGLQPKYYELIKDGVKIYEGRLNDEKRQLISVGDIVVLQKDPERKEQFKAKVVEKLLFSSFEEMAKCLDAKELGFENQSPQQIKEIYREFYSEKQEKEFGVLALKIKVLD